jgi:hypothetical protein
MPKEVVEIKSTDNPANTTQSTGDIRVLTYNPYNKSKSSKLYNFVEPLSRPVNQLPLVEKKRLALELNKKQKRIEELENELRIAKRMLPDDGRKIEQALYRNPLESIATLLMMYEQGSATIGDIEEICKEKMLEVLCDCIKSELIHDLEGKLTLTTLGKQFAGGLQQMHK